MSKELMISIRPKHAYNIIVGKKTLELRTWIPKDYVGWVYVYVSKTIRNYKMSYYYQPKNQENIYRLHGNIPFRFWFDDYTKLKFGRWVNHKVGDWNYRGYMDEHLETFKKACLTEEEVNHYGNGKTLYAWDIKQLEIFDTPKELSEFESRTPYKNNDGRVVAWGHRPIIRAPQKMVWVYAKDLEDE